MCPANETENATDIANITGVILAGGRATRMEGQDKGLITINGRPLIEYVLEALAPQVDQIIINVNRNLDRYGELGYRFITDSNGDYLGPLAGIASGLKATDKPYIAVVPCDALLLRRDLVARLGAALADSEAQIAVEHDGKQLQPVYCLISRTLLSDLQEFLDSGGRTAHQWITRHPIEIVDFSDCPNNFLNINEPKDQAMIEERLAGQNVNTE